MSKMSRCHYHLCEFSFGGIKTCPYCKQTYCSYHINPKAPDFSDGIVRHGIFEYYVWERAHPCRAYVDYLAGTTYILDKRADMKAEEMRKKKIDKMLKELENERRKTEKHKNSMNHQEQISNNSPIHHYAKNEKPYNPWKDKENNKTEGFVPEPYTSSNNKPNISEIRSTLKKIFINVLVFLVCLFLIYAALSPFIGFSLVENSSFVKGIQGILLEWKNEIYHTKNCTSTIKNEQCFLSKPQFCINGKIINNSEICGCSDGYKPYQNNCIKKIYCSDGSLSPDCSQNKPYLCLNGTLILKASVCGCPENYMAVNDTCEKIKRCIDETIYSQCSKNKPLFCEKDALIERASMCGCPENYMAVNDICEEIKRCIDGTIYGQCSKNQPLFCEKGALLERASMCGCSEGLVIESIGNTNGEKCVINRNFNTQTSGTGTSAPANLYEVESQIHVLINEQRGANGLSALNFDEALATIARKHSQDMAARCYFDHYDPEGHDFLWRMQQDGYNCKIVIGNTIHQGGENIFLAEGVVTSNLASSAVNGWMSSSGHRANILTSFWRNEGIGVAKSNSGVAYVTQVFC